MKKRLFFLSIFVSIFIFPKNITKVVIPAAGLGTRFLPFTIAVPKEMLLIGNTPAIQLIVKEGALSGINNFIFIVNERKKTIQKHFDIENLSLLKENKKYNLITETDKLFQSLQFSYIDQPTPRGLGDAILHAERIVGDEYFAVMLPDDLFFGSDPELQKLIEVALQEKASVIAVQEVPLDTVSSYGIIGIKQWIKHNVYEITDLIEKPHPSQAPSNLGCAGRYILSPKIFNSLKQLSAKLENGELQLTDAIVHMMKTTGEKVIAYKIKGTRYDTGTPIGWIKAVATEAFENVLYQDQFIKFIQEKLDEFKSK